MVVATTHFDALKTYASTTEGVTSAGFGFNPETFAPTYRLHYGSPGSSLALEIATRLGLPGGIIEQARAQRTKREAQLAEHLAQVERERQGLEHEHRLVARERQMVEETQEKLQGREQELRDREETFRKRLDQKIEERLRDARREIDIGGGRAEGARAIARFRRAAPGADGRHRGGAGGCAQRAGGCRGNRLREAVEWSAFAPFGGFGETSDPLGWRRVAVGALGLEGIVQSIHDGHAEVDVRGKRMRARLDDLRVITPARPAARRRHACTSTSRWRRATTAVSEINVIGAHAEEAVERVERFLDEAMVAELRSLRIIHGYGTGRAAAIDRRVPARARVRREFPSRPGQPGRRRRHGGGVEGVMPLFPANFVDDLKSHVDIVQVVQERVPLRKMAARPGKGCARSMARRRRRSTSTATRGSSTASAAASAAT